MFLLFHLDKVSFEATLGNFSKSGRPYFERTRQPRAHEKMATHLNPCAVCVRCAHSPERHGEIETFPLTKEWTLATPGFAPRG